MNLVFVARKRFKFAFGKVLNEPKCLPIASILGVKLEIIIMFGNNKLTPGPNDQSRVPNCKKNKAPKYNVMLCWQILAQN